MYVCTKIEPGASRRNDAMLESFPCLNSFLPHATTTFFQICKPRSFAVVIAQQMGYRMELGANSVGSAPYFRYRLKPSPDFDEQLGRTAQASAQFYSQAWTNCYFLQNLCEI